MIRIASVCSLHLRVFRLGLFQNADLRVGVIPECQEVLVSGERQCCPRASSCILTRRSCRRRISPLLFSAEPIPLRFPFWRDSSQSISARTVHRKENLVEGISASGRGWNRHHPRNHNNSGWQGLRLRLYPHPFRSLSRRRPEVTFFCPNGAFTQLSAIRKHARIVCRKVASQAPG
jgi:hypothetical protein